MDIQTRHPDLDQAYEHLPPDLKDILYNEDTAVSMDNIAIRNSLTMQQEGTVSEVTGLVLFGVLHPNKYIDVLALNLKVDREIAKQIANDVNQEVFQKVRESLRKVYNLSEEEAPTKQTVKITQEEKQTDSYKLVTPTESLPRSPYVTQKLPAMKSEKPEKPKFIAPSSFAKATEDRPPSPQSAKNLPPPVMRVAPQRFAPKPELHPIEIRPIPGLAEKKISQPEPVKLPPKILTPEHSKPSPPPVAPPPTPLQEEVAEKVFYGDLPPAQKLSQIIKEERTHSSEIPGTQTKARDRGLNIMPTSPDQIKKVAKQTAIPARQVRPVPIPSAPREAAEPKSQSVPQQKPPEPAAPERSQVAPPTGMAFLDTKQEKKLEPHTQEKSAALSHHDPYREDF